MPPKKRKVESIPGKSCNKITNFLINSRVETSERAECTWSEDQNEANSSIKSVDGNDQPKKQQVKFNDKWLKLHGWLRYDSDKNEMHCHYCRGLNMLNNMAVGTNNFRTTTLQRHITSSDHTTAIAAPSASKGFQKAVENADTKEHAGMIKCIKIVYWLAKECIPLTKYTSLMALEDQLETPNLDCLKIGETIKYNSYTTACGVLEAISISIDSVVTQKLKESPVLTILTDESTDISVHHKLCISARIVEPATLEPSTHFLADLRITSATGIEIFKAIKIHLEERGIKIEKVSGLGTDGATVMTGRKNGLTGQFLRYNPHLVSTHCSAHRLALCSEQAADKIPAMKYFQQVLESLYYYFKKSPSRCDSMESVQKVLNDPVLKYREVHQIRWLSFYQALDAVYRTLDSLLSFFTTSIDVKAKGFQKKLSDHFFLYMIYSMMDILQPVMKLNLFFQRKDIDIGCVQVCVDQCLKDLQAMFPDKQLMTSFCALGLRPITLLTEEEVTDWGNDSIDVLISHFGKKQTHTFTDDEGRVKTTTSEPLIKENATKEEWHNLKQTVRTQMYPRPSTAALWKLIMSYHSEEFPNLYKLASLALSHPVHTSDCERAFSSQNKITTPLRNRISPDHCDQLMRVVIEGPPLREFDCASALRVWQSKKSRLILKKSLEKI